MISATIFSKFPTIGYNNQTITDISIRLGFDKTVQKNAVAFYPYTIIEGERADIIAHRYYGDASYSWLIYFANNITRPQEEWPKTTNQFDEFIKAEYGSIESAQKKIMFFRNEWVSDDSMLNNSGYNALPSTNKKYWEPNYGASGQVISYTRKQEDWTVENIEIDQLVFKDGLMIEVAEDVLLEQYTGGDVTARGEVRSVDGNNVTIRLIEGEFIVDKTVYCGDVSVGQLSVNTLLSSSLNAEERGYWAPVNAYDYEMEINEARKIIYLIDSSYVSMIEREIRNLVS